MTGTSTDKREARRAALLHVLSKAPFAIVASSLQGAVNYVIVVYLAYAEGLAETGIYRTLFSYFGLLALASMFETNKVFIRSIVAEDHEATTALFATMGIPLLATRCIFRSFH